MENMVKNICEAHKREYGELPKTVISTPGRIHIMGEHSCWFFKDKTLSLAVNMNVYVAISLRDDNSLRFFFVQLDERRKSDISSIKQKKEDRWANSLKAIIQSYLAMGFKLG